MSLGKGFLLLFRVLRVSFEGAWGIVVLVTSLSVCVLCVNEGGGAESALRGTPVWQPVDTGLSCPLLLGWGVT